ncbi:glycoside hydrolase family 25 protein [Winogradskyella rapida]|uniref:Glycoside hydrolase family 25 protein n=1 Tax=Winogradskyella rapida TaxID=549701 RepID=A0ABW3KMN5_9FLAO
MDYSLGCPPPPHLIGLYHKKIATKKKSKANAEEENLNPEIDKPKENRYFRFLKKNSLLIGIILGQLIIIIALASSITTNYYPIKNLRENPSISSSEYLFGIDISHYQGKINWTEMQTSHHPIEYIFIRSTMGKNGTDIHFEDNWKNAKAHNYIRGAYHYYRPNENSTLQFENYKSIVKLNKGDFVPILDIEKESRFGRENLRTGVLNWLQLAEEEYGVKPMIYTGLKFYQHILKGHVDDYPLWIAAYSGKHRVKHERWTFHQFTEKAIVKGISTTVDGNDYNGTLDDLKTMLKK